MRQRLVTVVGRLVVCLLVVAAGCTGGGGGHSAGGRGGSGESAGSATTTVRPAAVPSALTVTTHEYGFDLPSEVQGGVVTLSLQNNGRRKHEAVVVASGDMSVARVKKDLEPIARSEEKATPDYLHFQGGVSLVPAGTSASSTLTLPPGRYVMVCTLTDADSFDPASADSGSSSPKSDKLHFDLGMARAFTVKEANTAVVPAGDGTVLARDWSFDVPPLTSGVKTLVFRNDGQQDHTAALSEFPDGVGREAAISAFEALLAAEGHPPADDVPIPDDVAFAGPLSAGGQATFTVGLKPNRTYVFACYLSDRAGGPVHAKAKKMVAYLTTPPG